MQDGETLEIIGYEEAPFRDSGGSVSLKLTGELGAVDSACEKCLEPGYDALNFLRGFVHEFQTKVVDSCFAPCLHVRTRLLRLRTEDSVPAADIGDYRMRAAL